MPLEPVSYGSINSQADFSPLAKLGDVYRQAQSDQLKQGVLGQLGPDAAANANLLVSSGHPELAQLGLTLQNRLADRSYQASRDLVSDQHYTADFELKKRAADRADQTVTEGAAERKAAALANGADLKDPAVQNWILTGKQLPDPIGQGGNKYGLNPMFGVDEKTGEVVPMQLSGTGVAARTALPPGVTVSQKPIMIDRGTSIDVMDPITRQVVRTIPKDIAGKAQQEAIGEASGKAAGTLPELQSTANDQIGQIEALIHHPGKKWAVGSSSYLPMVAGTSQADFIKRLDQVKGGSFLTAYNTLRGGGAITEVEGAKGTAAINRMDRAQSQEEFDTAAREVQGYLKNAVERMRAKAVLPGRLQAEGISRAQPTETGGEVLTRARAAISAGRDPAIVRQRLIDAGIDPSGL